MNLWFRLLRVLIAACLARRQGLLHASTIQFRVLPHDLDLNMHMNNARYLSLMDLGRVDLVCRCGLWRSMAAKRWQMVIGGAMVRFRRPLKLFQRLTLSSRVVGWDDRWFYIEHAIVAAAVPACLMMVRAALLDGGSVVSPAVALAKLGFDEPQPPIPDWAGHWSAAEAAAFTPSPCKEERTCAR